MRQAVPNAVDALPTMRISPRIKSRRAVFIISSAAYIRPDCLPVNGKYVFMTLIRSETGASFPHVPSPRPPPRPRRRAALRLHLDRALPALVRAVERRALRLRAQIGRAQVCT